MAWFMIILGIALFLVGIYRVYLERKRMGNKFPVNSLKAVAQKTAHNKTENNSDQELKDRMLENYNGLNELNKEMDSIIKEISRKKNKIRTDLDIIKKEEREFNNSSQLFHKIYAEKINGSKENSEKSSQEASRSRGNTDSSQHKTPNTKKNQLSEKYEQALNLQKNGDSIAEIARKMNLGIRETELIFKLHGKEDIDVNG